MGEQAIALHHPAHTAAQMYRVQPGHILAPEADRSGGRLQQAVDHFQRGRLAAAGFAHQCQQCTFADCKAGRIDGLGAAGEDLGQCLDIQYQAITVLEIVEIDIENGDLEGIGRLALIDILGDYTQAF